MRRVLATALVIGGVLSACTTGSGDAVTGQTGATSTPGASPSTSPLGSDADADADATFERDLRRLLSVPPMPAFAIPTQLLTTPEHERIAQELEVAPGLYDGIAVLDARCVATGADAVAADAGAVVGGGAQHYEDAAVSITVGGDGSGVYDAEGIHVVVQANGAGVYDDGETRLSVAADGSGAFRSGDRRYTVQADGSGAYSDADVRVWIDADGAGGFEDDAMRLSMNAEGEVFGDGDPERVAAVRAVLADGLPRFAPVPAIASVEPAGTVCGTVIRLDANVMFDLASADVRPEGQVELAKVAALLTALGSPGAQVDGHTDHLGDEESNVELSERRAGAVRDLLVAAGVEPGSLATRGLGESEPLRVETLADGSDDPAARQLNRRVEIVLLDPP